MQTHVAGVESVSFAGPLHARVSVSFFLSLFCFSLSPFLRLSLILCLCLLVSLFLLSLPSRPTGPAPMALAVSCETSSSCGHVLLQSWQNGRTTDANGGNVIVAGGPSRSYER